MSTEEVERRIRVVFAVIIGAVNAGEINDIADELGDDYSEFLGRTARVEREMQQAHERDFAASSASTTRQPTAPRVGASVVQTLNGLLVHALAVVVEVAIVAVRAPVDAGLRVANSLRH